jgi:hypothetical protein
MDGQRQALSEAWDALVEITYEYNTQSMASRLRADNQSRYDRYPSLAPNRSRQQQWKQWMLEQLADNPLQTGFAGLTASGEAGRSPR